MRDTKGRKIVTYSGDAPDTLTHMINLVRRLDQAKHARLLQRFRDKAAEIILASGAQPYDSDAQKVAIYDWLSAHTYWLSDPRVEYGTYPENLLDEIEKRGVAVEDCESFSVLLASFFFAIGQPVGFRVSAPVLTPEHKAAMEYTEQLLAAAPRGGWPAGSPEAAELAELQAAFPPPESHVYVVSPIERGGLAGAVRNGSAARINSEFHLGQDARMVSPGSLIAWDISIPDRDFGYENEGSEVLGTVMV